MITSSKENAYKKRRHADSHNKSFQVLNIFTKSEFATEI